MCKYWDVGAQRNYFLFNPLTAPACKISGLKSAHTRKANGGLGMCQPNDFYLRVFTFWFDTEKALFQGNFGFDITKY